MVTNVADGALENLTLVVMPGEMPEAVDFEEEQSAGQECQYCGHSPCGCGG